MEIEVEMMKKNECFLEWHDEFKRELKRQDNEQLKMFEGKPKRFKNWPNSVKHAIFAIGLSRKQVAKASFQNT